MGVEVAHTKMVGRCSTRHNGTDPYMDEVALSPRFRYFAADTARSDSPIRKTEYVSLRAGPFTFRHVTYDPPSDVLYAAIASPPSGQRQETPEHHILRFDERGKFAGMILVGPRAQLEREGGVFVSLPSGDRVRVQGAETVMRSAG
jgi:uncharacterized protein YuzE